MALDNDTRSDLLEVLAYAESAKGKLEQAERELKIARAAGVVDVFGGKLVVSAAKHHFMRKANRLIAEAQNSLQVMNNEMEDVTGLPGVKLETLNFSGLTDLLLDNPVSDVYVLNHIDKAVKQVREAQELLAGIIDDLRAALRT